MIRSVHIALAVAAAMAVAVAVTAPAIAAVPGPKGTLTASEYKQLTVQQAAFKKLRTKKDLTWNDFYAVCQRVGQSTLLLRSVYSNCNAGIGIDQSLTGFYSDVARCAALETSTGTTTTTTQTATTTTGTGTTTTGTTTTGTATTGTDTTATSNLSPAELKLLACMQPEYAVISRAVKSIDTTQTTLRSQVLARHFVGRCELTLAPTEQQLHDLDRWTSTAKQLAADVTLISKVADGRAPAKAIHGKQVTRDANAFDAAAKAFERLSRPQNLAVCPHQ